MLTQQYASYEFESSSNTTLEFNAFSRSAKAELTKALAKAGLELATWNKGHFYLSGFVYNPQTDKYAYFSLEDVRGGGAGRALNNVLVRTAEHVKDYRGGQNNFTSWDNIITDFTRLTRGAQS